MALYLVQHGLSLSKAIDPEKGLSEQGRQDVERIAQVAAAYEVPVAQIWHSGKQRTAQTAQIFSNHLNPEDGLLAIDGINPLDDVPGFAATLDLTLNRMIVGHLPFLERLIAFLVTGRHEPHIFQMQNGGMVCLDYHKDTTRVIVKWALMPKIP